MKKKPIRAWTDYGIPWRKTLTFMKFLGVIMLGICLSAHANAYSQQEKVFLEMKQAPLNDVLKELRRQTKMEFLYNHDLVRGINVDVKSDNKKLSEVLDELLPALGLEYSRDGNVIVIRAQQPAAQQKEHVVKGKVLDNKKQPLPGVTVRVEGTSSTGTATDRDGSFTLRLPVERGSLIFSFVGFKTQTVAFEAGKELNITMQEDVSNLDEVTVVAYGTTTKREMTGSISVVKADEIKGIPSSSIANLLQGRVAGMDITNITGAPGGGDIAVTVRGYNSLDIEQGRRFSNPLWVVDGVPLNSFTSPITGSNLLSDLNPDMIESVQVLKDASSAAIYGSRAANGVIIVTTKKGHKNQDATFSVNVSQSWSILPRFPTVTTGNAERNLRLLGVKNDFRAYLNPETNRWTYPKSLAEQYENPTGTLDGNWFPDRDNLSTDKGSIYQDSLNSFYSNSSNFFRAFFETGKITNANIQTFGGMERMNYAIGLGYYNEKGIYKGTGYNRIDLHSQMQVVPVPRLSVDLRLNASLSEKKRASSGGSIGSGYVPLETISGEPYQLSSLIPGENSVVWDELLRVFSASKEDNRSVRLRTNFMLGYDIMDGMRLSSSFAADYAINKRNYFSPSTIGTEGVSNSTGETGIDLMVLNENLLSYKKVFKGVHALNAVLGFSYQYDQTEYSGGYAKNSPSDKIYYAPAGLPNLGTREFNGYTDIIAYKNYISDMQEKALISYFFRLEYRFREKYLLSAAFRRDGSSTFGKNNRWGAFPSIAAGWNFSEEPLIKDNIPWLSFGKLRASWGRSGMHFSQNYLALGIMQIGTSYFGDGTIAPVWYNGLYNDELSWEETDQYDFGFDLDLFDYRLGIVMDYYYRYTDKLLNTVPLISGGYSGYGSQWRNAEAISNEGIELMVKYEILRKSDLYWKVSVNGARNWNRYVKSYDDMDHGYRIIGKPLNGIWELQVDGFVNSADELPIYFNAAGASHYISAGSYNAQYKPGDYKYVDLNKDGSIGLEDFTYSGSALPELSGGITNEFRWKNFDLNLLFSYQLGRHIKNATVLRPLDSVAANEYPALVMDLGKITFWEKPGDNPDYPLYQKNNGGWLWSGNASHVEKVNWLKLKTVTMGYSFSKEQMKKLGLKELRFFVSGENLLTWSNYSGMDPETVDIRSGVDSSNSYPLARKFTLGVTLNF